MDYNLTFNPALKPKCSQKPLCFLASAPFTQPCFQTGKFRRRSRFLCGSIFIWNVSPYTASDGRPWSRGQVRGGRQDPWTERRICYGGRKLGRWTDPLARHPARSGSVSRSPEAVVPEGQVVCLPLSAPDAARVLRRCGSCALCQLGMSQGDGEVSQRDGEVGIWNRGESFYVFTQSQRFGVQAGMGMDLDDS